MAKNDKELNRSYTKSQWVAKLSLDKSYTFPFYRVNKVYNIHQSVFKSFSDISHPLCQKDL